MNVSAECRSETSGSKNDRKFLRWIFYSQEWILYCIVSYNSLTNISCYHDFVSSSVSKMTRYQTHQTSDLHLYTENWSLHFIWRVLRQTNRSMRDLCLNIVAPHKGRKPTLTELLPQSRVERMSSRQATIDCSIILPVLSISVTLCSTTQWKGVAGLAVRQVLLNPLMSSGHYMYHHV
jgi:hypothetical protein